MMAQSVLEGRVGLRLVSTLIRAMQFVLLLALAACLASLVLPESWRFGLLAFGSVLVVIALAASLASDRLKDIQVRSYKSHVDAINATHEQIEELFSMTDTLQSANSNADAAQVLRATSRKLLPGAVCFS